MSHSETLARVPIAVRKLERKNGLTVELIVHAPTLDPESSGGDWVCEIEIVESGIATTHRGHGVDSLQALVGGLGALREAVKNLGIRDLSWLAQAGVVGLPLVVQEHDEDFLALIETLITVEHMRLLVHRRRHAKK